MNYVLVALGVLFTAIAVVAIRRSRRQSQKSPLNEAKTMTRRNAAAVFMKNKRRAAPPSSPRASDISGATDSRCSR